MPLKVTILLFGEARDLAGTRSVIVEMQVASCEVREILHALQEVTGAKLMGRVLVAGAGGDISLVPGYKLMVNKRIMNLQEAKDMALKDTDEVGILPPFSGG